VSGIVDTIRAGNEPEQAFLQSRRDSLDA